MCPIPNAFQDRAILNINRKIVDKKEILLVRAVSITGIYCSPDLTPLDFCLWGWMKSEVYRKIQVQSMTVLLKM